MMIQRYDFCREHTTVKLLLMHEDEAGKQKMLQCYAYGEMVQQISGGGDVSAEVILRAAKFKVHDPNQRQKFIKEVKQRTDSTSLFILLITS